MAEHRSPKPKGRGSKPFSPATFKGLLLPACKRVKMRLIKVPLRRFSGK